MHILVTGGAGYIGSHVVRALLQAGHSVVVLDDLSTGHRELLAGLHGVTLVEGDLGNPNLLAQAFDLFPVAAVVHIAGKALVSQSMSDPASYYRVNTTAGLELLDAMRDRGVRRIVFSSTCAVYGTPDERPVTEGARKKPESPYGDSKWAFETALQAYRAYGLQPIALRYFNVAGACADGSAGELHIPETHLIPNLLLANPNRPFHLFGTDYDTRDGTCERDFLHVEDLSRAHLLALEYEGDPGTFGGALNLGLGHGVTVREILVAAEEILGREIPTLEAPRRPGDVSSIYADCSLAQAQLGWKPQLDLASMIRSAHDFYTGRPG
tara:strand:+ start:12908 stop:13882 length:975 start_codon:yes stop_codon:yes gene_type:complete